MNSILNGWDFAETEESISKNTLNIKKLKVFNKTNIQVNTFGIFSGKHFWGRKIEIYTVMDNDCLTTLYKH